MRARRKLLAVVSAMWLISTFLALIPSSTYASPLADPVAPGVDLSGNGENRVITVDLASGAKIGLMFGDVQALNKGQGMFGGNDTKFTFHGLNHYWQLARDIGAVCVSSAGGWELGNPHLRHPLKVNGIVATEGWDTQGLSKGSLVMLELFGNSARISPLSSKEQFYGSSAQNILVGYHWDDPGDNLGDNENNGGSRGTSRTVLGIKNDGKTIVIAVHKGDIIFHPGANNQHGDKTTMVEYMENLGISRENLLVLDGGKTTQLNCEGETLIKGQVLPSAIAVIPAGTSPQPQPTLTPTPEEGDDVFRIPYKKGDYTVTQGIHGQSYGHFAVDLAGGKGTTIYSPINGVVKKKYTDQYGNPTLVLENSRWRVTLLHGNFSVNVGDRVKIGQKIGKEGNQGIVECADGKRPNGRNCGYHTHVNLYDKNKGKNVNPLNKSQDMPGPVLNPDESEPLGNLDIVGANPGYLILGIFLLVLTTGLVAKPKGTIRATWWAISTTGKVTWTVVRVTGKSAVFLVRVGWKVYYYVDSFVQGVTRLERERNRRIRLSSCITVLIMSSCICSLAFFVVTSERVGAETVIAYILSRSEQLKPLAKVVETVKKFQDVYERRPRISLVPDQITIPVIDRDVDVRVPTVWRKKPVFMPPPPGAIAVQAKISHYVPWFGGPNCANFKDGRCLSRMASGLPWQNFVSRAVACPKDYPFWTRVYAFGQEWICLDRGGKIVREGSLIWLDFLANPAPENTPYGEIRTVYVVFPSRSERR